MDGSQISGHGLSLVYPFPVGHGVWQQHPRNLAPGQHRPIHQCSARPASSAARQVATARHSCFFHPSKRAGRKSTVRNNAKTADTVMPIRRSGNDKSQTTGNRTSASSAMGQQSTNKIHQPTKRSRAFMFLTFHLCADCQLLPKGDSTKTCPCIERQSSHQQTVSSGQAIPHSRDPQVHDRGAPRGQRSRLASADRRPHRQRQRRQ
jgi:hypothetical protein